MENDGSAGVSGVFEQILGTINYGLNRYIDSEFAQPWGVNDPAGWQYASGPNGSYYVRGYPSAQPAAAQPVAANPLMLLVLVGFAYLALR